jgi:hypothetical protein
MARWVHRQDDARDCGAGTVTQCTNVRVNSKFISIQDDTNTHGSGMLIATDTVGKVLVNGKPVILQSDPARPDGLCPGPFHCNPKANEASPNVRAGNGS